MLSESIHEDLVNTNTTSDQTERETSRKFQALLEKATSAHQSLSETCYQSEMDHVAEKLQFNIIVMGSPRVGKSSLINALCGKDLAETSSSLNPCTPDITSYTLEDDQQRNPNVKPFKIHFHDTPGIESWTDQAGEKKMIEFIEKINPVCVIYCASPGSLAKLDQLHSVLEYCKQREIFCALVCTNMWGDNKRRDVIREFEKQLEFFGDKIEKESRLAIYRKPHQITFFGRGALCTMVNSKEYYDPDFTDQKMPVQGVDELIHGIMESLDEEKLLGWCYAVLEQRSYWQKISQKVGGFFQLRFDHLYVFMKSSTEDVARNFTNYFSKQQSSKKTD